MIKAVVFDVGETLVDESREYGTWADWLGVAGNQTSRAGEILRKLDLPADLIATSAESRPGER